MKNAFSLKINMKLDYDLDISYLKKMKKDAFAIFVLVFFVFFFDIVINYKTFLSLATNTSYLWWLFYIFLITITAYTSYQSYLITNFLFRVNKYTKQLFLYLIKIFLYMIIELFGIVILIIIPYRVVSFFFILFFVINLVSYAYFVFNIYKHNLKKEKELELYVPFVEKKQKNIKI